MMLSLVRGRCDQADTSAVVVTPEVHLAAELATRVMLLKDGRMLAMGSPGEVLTAELLKKIFGLQVLVDAHPITGAPRITPVHVIVPSSGGRGSQAPVINNR
jgi:ABC-type hemin transport system ATPase subunit